MASVPLPAQRKGWLDASAWTTSRRSSRERPNASISRGDVWPGGGPAAAARTAGETSTGPGIIRRGAVSTEGCYQPGDQRRGGEKKKRGRPEDVSVVPVSPG